MEIKPIDLTISEQIKAYFALIEWSRNYITSKVGMNYEKQGDQTRPKLNKNESNKS